VVVAEALYGRKLRLGEVRALDEDDHPFRPLLLRLLAEEPAARPSTGQLLQHPLFREDPPLWECVVCGDHFALADGVLCGAAAATAAVGAAAGAGDDDGDGDGPPAGSHFMCSSPCLEGHVRALSGQELRRLQQRGARVGCPVPGCGAPAFSHAQVLRCHRCCSWPPVLLAERRLQLFCRLLTARPPPRRHAALVCFPPLQVSARVCAEAFDLYMAAMNRVAEAQLADELQRQQQAEMRAELQRLQVPSSAPL
jgi:hypothetical protein